MRTSSQQAAMRQSQATAVCYDKIAELLAKKGYRKVPEDEVLEQLLAESTLSLKELGWYRQAREHPDFDSTLEEHLTDVRAKNPA